MFYVSFYSILYLRLMHAIPWDYSLFLFLVFTSQYGYMKILSFYFYCRWPFELFPVFHYYKQCHHENSYTFTLMLRVWISLGKIPGSGILGWINLTTYCVAKTFSKMRVVIVLHHCQYLTLLNLFFFNFCHSDVCLIIFFIVV